MASDMRLNEILNNHETCEKSPKSSVVPENKGEGTYSHQRVSNPIPTARPSRISRQQLQNTMLRLTPLDWEVLETIRQCTVILGRQIGRLFFWDRGPRATAIAASRELSRLEEYGLLADTVMIPKERLRGRLAKVYHLTEAGERALQIRHGERETKRRFAIPSPAKLAHSIAVTECAVKIQEAGRSEGVEVQSITYEPDCWRSYTRRDKAYVLKPDLSAITKVRAIDEEGQPWYTVWWYIEVDLGSEGISQVLGKCRRYYEFCRSTAAKDFPEDVFPMVLWVVKTEARRELLIQRISEEFKGQEAIFTVVLDSELALLMCDKIDVEDYECPR